MASIRQFPPPLARRLAGRTGAGLLLTAVIAIVLAAGFSLNEIASIGSAVALLVFAFVTAGHLRVRADTGANAVLLALAVGTALLVFIAFVFTTLVNEPVTAIMIVAILLLSVLLDLAWKRRREAKDSLTGTRPRHEG